MIPRFNISIDQNLANEPRVKWYPSNEGEWVRYSHVADLQAKLDALHSFCERFTNGHPDWQDEYEALGDKT